MKIRKDIIVLGWKNQIYENSILKLTFCWAVISQVMVPPKNYFSDILKENIILHLLRIPNMGQKFNKL